jgi:methyl-accepting chemotaxis protein
VAVQERKTRGASRSSGARAAASPNGVVAEKDLQRLLDALKSARDGDFSQRIPAARKDGILGEIAETVNEVLETHERMTRELVRVARVIGREGKLNERAQLPSAKGDWQTKVEAVNSLIDDLARPTQEVARVIDAVAQGDLGQKIALKIDGQPVKGEFLRIGTTVNSMVDQLSSFADEVTRVAREVGTEGVLGGRRR